MFEHKHDWRHMHTSGADWDWFFCKGCLAEACQKVDINTGTVERYIYEHKKSTKTKR